MLNHVSDTVKIERVSEIKNRVTIILLKNFGILIPKFVDSSSSRGHWHYKFSFVPFELLLLSKLHHFHESHSAKKTTK